MNIKESDILIIDCQATLANPEKGNVLELAWMRMNNDKPIEAIGEEIVSYLIQVPAAVEVPPQVSRITGLKREDLVNGSPIQEVWQELLKTVEQITTLSSDGTCPTVIHFAQYETPFLHHLHNQYNKGQPFPFDIYCTHKIARRLLPDLPRKSLRAIAGYFGFTVPEQRRSSHHIEATAVIWSNALALLEEKEVTTFEQLRTWLSGKVPAPASKAPRFPMPPEIRKTLPDSPGVYRMLRSNGDLLYIGKATSLKGRVASYFHKKKPKVERSQIPEMLTQAYDLDVTVTGSALEAALLESDEIKRHEPQYNKALRERDREIAFFSADLTRNSTMAGEEFPLGPLPSTRFFEPFANIFLLLKGQLDLDQFKAEDSDEDSGALFLGMRPQYAPDINSFTLGLELFKEDVCQQLDQLGGLSRLSSLFQLGKELYRKKLEEEQAALEAKEMQESSIDDEEELEIEEETERVWTPELVERVLKGIVRSGAHLMRRARWFCLLNDSMLVWQSGDTSGRQRRCLHIQHGAITDRSTLETDEPIPRLSTSPLLGDRQDILRDRKNCFDVVTYDRLRVLTTEIRRLVFDKRDRQVQLILDSAVVLENGQLKKLLKWI